MSTPPAVEESLAARARAGGVAFTFDVVRYVLLGSRLRDLRRSALLLGPRAAGQVFLARTDWTVAWTVGDCEVPLVEVTGVVRVPSWRPPRTASSEDVASWRAIAAAIEAHEKRHLAFGVDGALRVRRVLNDALACPITPTREVLRAAIDGELDEVREQERRFDEDTAHGAREGVTLWRPPA